MTEKNNIYNIILEIKQDLGEVKGILKGLPCVDHTKRLNEVEKEVDQLVGKSVIIGGIFGLIGGAVLTFLGYFIRK